MDYLPLFIDLKHRQCLVVGGGDIAARKAGLLLKAGGHVTLIAPQIYEMSRQLLESMNIREELIGKSSVSHRICWTNRCW